VQVQGYSSAAELLKAIQTKFGVDSLRLVGDFGPSFDAFGFVLSEKPRYLFSVSTHAGELPFGLYNLQVSISDDSLENGEIVALDELGVAKCLGIVQGIQSGAIS